MPDMTFDAFNIMAEDANEVEELALTVSMISNYKKMCEEQGIIP